MRQLRGLIRATGPAMRQTNLVNEDAMGDLRTIVDRILELRPSVRDRAVLVALSGIDGSGKGWLTARIAAELQSAGVKAANINIDGWLNLPAKRFSRTDPAEHFYRHAIRFDDMFAQLVLPLRDRRSVYVEADFAEETATEYKRHLYDYRNIDVILFDGIYLFKREFRQYYDLSIWVESSFETALKRALARGQEGLPPAETIHAYETIYFPAQGIHFHRDHPKQAATMIFNNDAERP
jgi:uridine kinase